ncbi:MAG: hypothetical protein ACYC8T_30710 [Myxococcaceae bacterium]
MSGARVEELVSGSPAVRAERAGWEAARLDALARAVALRRLQDSTARHDAAVRDYRVAVARWRRAAGPPGPSAHP